MQLTQHGSNTSKPALNKNLVTSRLADDQSAVGSQRNWMNDNVSAHPGLKPLPSLDSDSNPVLLFSVNIYNEVSTDSSYK